MNKIKDVNYKDLHLNKYGIPTAKAMMALMLNIALIRPFWESIDLRRECIKHLIIPTELKQLTFKTGTHPGTKRLNYNLNWTLHNLYFYGALSHVSYAKYQITKLGKLALNECGYNYVTLNKYLLKNARKSKTYYQISKSRRNTETVTDIYSNTINTINELNLKWGHQLIKTILSKNPYFFEELVVQLLAKMGYKGTHGLAKQTQKSNDGGIDGIIKKDPLGTSTVYVQAKRYASSDKVTKNEIKNFYTSVQDRNSSRGVFITTSSFNSGARTEAKLHSIILINGHDLIKFMIKYGIGVQRKPVYIATGIDKDFFDEK